MAVSERASDTRAVASCQLAVGSCPQSRCFCVSALQEYAVDAHVLTWSDSRREGRRRLPVMTDGKYAMDDHQKTHTLSPSVSLSLSLDLSRSPCTSKRHKAGCCIAAGPLGSCRAKAAGQKNPPTPPRHSTTHHAPRAHTPKAWQSGSGLSFDPLSRESV